MNQITPSAGFPQVERTNKYILSLVDFEQRVTERIIVTRSDSIQ
jgi:hypothetical protein